MAQRDLTFNNPQFQGEERPTNPFSTPEEEARSMSSSQRSSATSSSEDDPLHAQYGRPFNAYNGYYSQNEGTTSKLLSNDNSSNEDRTPASRSNYSNNLANYANNGANSNSNATNIQVPSEYDRYPSMAGSRVVSSSSLNNMGPNGQLGHKSSSLQQKSDGDSSSMSSDPFSHGDDFSPFGGYPASSFPLHIDEKEADDYLHNPDPIADANYDKNRFMADLKNMDKKSLGGLVGVIGLLIGALVLFILVPVLTYSGVTSHYKPETYEVLTDYKYPLLSAIRTSLVDPDTPGEAMSKTAKDDSKWTLVFSDEFNAEGRTFYEGDDQFFTAPDLHYDATKDLEWYDPDAVTTANGTLNLRMDAYKNHDLFYRSGMVQSWNKMCFTQGRIEVSARLPNYGGFSGLWPGIWTMGNLGRPGYLATTEGVWPYSYDSCDAGITANQSSPDGISYLPGQRLNSCTCPGESHPNRGAGRGAPEIDVIEAEADTKTGVGVASQSLQLAPFDIWYYPDYNFIEIFNDSVTTMNTYTGGPFQEALSATTTLNITWYERGYNDHNFQNYGFEYLNDDTEGYLRWFVGEDPTMTVYANALHPNGNIGWRRLSKEPMSIVMNMGISNNWAYIDWPSLHFPVTMRIDYVRVYQPKDDVNIGCDPDDFPTSNYIQSHLNIYENVNLTSFESGGYKVPKNSLLHQC